MADGDEPAEPDANWTVQLDNVQRIASDEPEVDGENLFSVELRAVGPNVNADVEVLTSDIADESQVVAQAMDVA